MRVVHVRGRVRQSMAKNVRWMEEGEGGTERGSEGVKK